MSLENDALAIVRSIKGDAEPKAARDIYAEIVLADGTYYARADGSDELAPIESAVTVHHGDRVIVHIIDHRCVVVQNITVPSVNDEQYEHVKDIAEEANTLLDGVAEAAAQADKTVAEILSDANTASGIVDGMQQAAQQADKSLDQIVADAAEADTTLDSMRQAAQAAHTTLNDVYADAVQAKAGAESATESANSALGQLGIVQDVIGVLDWASKHGVFTATQDTAVEASKVYFVRQGGDYVPVTNPAENPKQAGYYELSMDAPDAERMQEFILAHLAVTQRGLWVLPAGIGNAADEQHAAGYKMLLSSGGAYIYDSQGDLVRSDTAEGTVFAEGKRWYVGGEDGYILYAPPTATSDGGITIGGSNVTIGDGRTLSELLAEVDGTIVFKVEDAYSQDGATATLTAHVYQGGVDVAQLHPEIYTDSCFAWYRKSETGGARVPLPAPNTNGRVISVSRADMGYGSAIACVFTPPNDSILLDGSDDTLTDSQDNPISARTPSGDYVRVADLTVETTVFDSDKLLVVGSEDEHLVTVSTLKEVFGDGDYERLTNRPSIEDVELVGNKTFPELGIFKTDDQGYSVPDDYTLTTMDINQLWANAQPVG